MTKDVSTAQQNWIREQERHRRHIRLGRFLLLCGFLLAWEGSVSLGWLNDFIFSSPTRILSTFVALARDGSIFRHIGFTLSETLISFTLVTVLGLAAAMLLWRYRLAAEILEPCLVTLNSLPKSALAPLLIVWLGNNARTIIVSAVSIAVFGSAVSLLTQFREADTDKIRLIRSLGGGTRDILFKVLLPGSLPALIANMKVNIGLCLIGVIIGEMLVCRNGLGYLIIYGSQVFKLDYILLSIFILCVIAMALYRVVGTLEKRVQT
ncbi:MAG: ABC transporter permease [Lachnospiraceae bacterium]|nr:ABC transporter permease [Lachnospiraceae bacterium]